MASGAESYGRSPRRMSQFRTFEAVVWGVGMGFYHGVRAELCRCCSGGGAGGDPSRFESYSRYLR